MSRSKVVDKIKTRILSSAKFFSPENRAVYDIVWKNMVDSERKQIIIRRMGIACWIIVATDTHLE
jgi:hypothetical protein